MDLLARFVGISMMFVIYIAVGVKGAAHGDACTTNADCTETNNVCTGSLCACSDDSFLATGTTTCTTKIALEGTCTATPTGQCADAHAECRDDTGLKCKCLANYFKTQTTTCAPVVGLDGTCDSTDSAADQCSVTNTECDSTENKCLCTSSYFSTGSACQTRLAFGAACSNTVTATNQCDLDGTECSLESGTTNYKCQCSAAYYESGSSTCVARKKPDEACAAGQCVTDATCNTVDGSLKCECDTGFTATPAVSSTMCSGVAKFATLSYMYVVPILVSMMFLFR